VLEIIGKDPGPKGIILPEEMPGAVSALQKAIEAEEADRKANGQGAPKSESVSLRQRAVPFIDMLQRCAREDKEIVWGV
jgi:hypothetical protein